MSNDFVPILSAFREYIEDGCAQDDRYGPAEREFAADGGAVAIRFDAGFGFRYAVSARISPCEVRVGLLADDPILMDTMRVMLEASAESPEMLVAMGFAEAGVNWERPLVIDAPTGVHTVLALDYADELAGNPVRDKVLRMLEGYLIAFGPAILGVEAGDGEEGE